MSVSKSINNIESHREKIDQTYPFINSKENTDHFQQLSQREKN